MRRFASVAVLAIQTRKASRPEDCRYEGTIRVARAWHFARLETGDPQLTPYLNLVFTFHYENLYLENVTVAGDGAVNHGVNKHGEAQARDQSRDDHNGKGALRV